MPGWVAGFAGTMVISVVSAYVFLRLRCRGAGNPFGHRARWWAVTVVVITAAVATGLGVAAVAAGDHVRAAYVGLIVPSVLWAGKASTRYRQQHGSVLPRTLVACLTLPLRRLDDRMGDDMQDWCDARSRPASKKPEWVSDAAQYYYNQVASRLKDDRKAEQLGRWLESIKHKIWIVRLVRLDTTPARLRAALQRHPSTRDTHTYATAELPRLARRLRSDAENELYLLLAYVYRLGYHKLLIYPFKAPPPPRTRRRRSRQGADESP
jgi:hypothetical protein